MSEPREGVLRHRALDRSRKLESRDHEQERSPVASHPRSLLAGVGREVGSVGLRDALARELLSLQRSHGNAFVQRLVSAGGQLSLRSPSLLQREDTPAPAGDDAAQKAEEEKAAKLRAMQAVQQTLDPKAVKPNLLLVPIPVTMPPPNPLSGPAPAKPGPIVPPGKGPDEAKEASAGDLAEAIMKVPAIDKAVDGLKEKALDQVKRDWRGLSTGEKVVTVSSLALVGGGALAGVASDKEARRFVLSQLDGVAVKVPGFDVLGVELNTKGNNVMVGLHVDVGKILPKELGFGPVGSFSPIGAPPGFEK